MASSTKSRRERGRGVFVACPMSSFVSEREYLAFKTRVVDFCRVLRQEETISWVFFAGENIGGFSAFDGHADAMKIDAERIWDAEDFILLYPGKILSSALVEVGIALGLRKPITIICAERNDLPYVLQNADTSNSDKIRRLRIIASDFSSASLCEIASKFSYDLEIA